MLQVSLKIVDPLLLLWLHEDRVSDQYVFASPISIVHSAVVVDIKVDCRRNCGVTSSVFLLIEQIIELMINKLHGLLPSGGLVSPSGGFASLLFD